jgi:allophanate hydrolase subunit 1
MNIQDLVQREIGKRRVLNKFKKMEKNKHEQDLKTTTRELTKDEIQQVITITEQEMDMLFDFDDEMVDIHEDLAEEILNQKDHLSRQERKRRRQIENEIRQEEIETNLRKNKRNLVQYLAPIDSLYFDEKLYVLSAVFEL